ncbi:MAG: arginase family protein [Hyphomicrobiales bacterium]
MPPSEKNIGSMYGSRETSTFLGLPACSDMAALEARIAIIGAGCATPYASVGAYCADAPVAIRAAMARYSATVSHYDFDLGGPLLGRALASAVDCGDLPFDEADASGNRDRIRAAVSTMLERGATPIVIGGDDSVPIPIFQAFEGRGRFAILQLDAHIDFRDEVGGGRWGLSSTMRRASELGCIGRIIQVGQRGGRLGAGSRLRGCSGGGRKIHLGASAAHEGHRPNARPRSQRGRPACHLRLRCA